MAKLRANGKKKVKRISKMLPPRPKKATNPFGAFLRQFWANLAENRTRASMGLASEQWFLLSPEQRIPYNNMVLADRNRYETEINVWKSQKAFLTRPATMYALFVKDIWARETAKNIGNLNVSQVGTMASTEWRAMTDEQKEPYRARFARAKNNYTLSIRDFRAGAPVNLNRQLDTEEEYVPLLPQPNQENHQDLDGWSDDEFDDDDLDDMDDDDLADLQLG